MTAEKPVHRILLFILALSAVTAAVALTSCPVAALPLGIDFALGTALNAGTTMSISQQGEPDLSLDADFATKPFTMPFYWDLRLRWQQGRTAGWALDLLHHKLYLEDPPPEVQEFTVTHGYNMLTVQRYWRRRGFDWTVGAGVVIAHPEITVRDRKLDESGRLFGAGYDLAGPVLAGAVGRRLSLTGKLDAFGEIRLTWSRATLSVDGGEARFSLMSLHLMIGLGFGP